MNSIHILTKSPLFVIAVSIFFVIGGIVAVMVAQKRLSGSTGLDAARIETLRSPKSESSP